MSEGLPDWKASLSREELADQATSKVLERRAREEQLQDLVTVKAFEDPTPALGREELEDCQPDYPWLPLVTCEKPAKANIHRAIVWLKLESTERLSLRDIAAIVHTSLGNVHNQLELHPYGEPCEICAKSFLHFEGLDPHLSLPETATRGQT